MAPDYAHSFGSQAARYAAVRPAYPAAALDLVFGSTRPAHVLDLAAGTGKLTASLLDRADAVTAVEPDPAMLAVLAEQLPGVQAMAGSAERIPLPDASVDAIVVGQALHWFARPDADREMARVLRPGGVVGLLWNFPDHAVEWVRRIYDATREPELPASAPQADLDRTLFTAAGTSELVSVHELPGPDGLISLARTWSWVNTRTPGEQQAIEHRLRILIQQYAELQGPVVRLPQRTKIVRQIRR